jgi:hypothetical protein
MFISNSHRIGINRIKKELQNRVTKITLSRHQKAVKKRNRKKKVEVELKWRWKMEDSGIEPLTY